MYIRWAVVVSDLEFPQCPWWEWCLEIPPPRRRRGGLFWMAPTLAGSLSAQPWSVCVCVCVCVCARAHACVHCVHWPTEKRSNSRNKMKCSTILWSSTSTSCCQYMWISTLSIERQPSFCGVALPGAVELHTSLNDITELAKIVL